MLRYDQTAITYAVDFDYFIDHGGESEVLPDVFASKTCRESTYSGKSFTSARVVHDQVKQWRKQISSSCQSGILNTSNLRGMSSSQQMLQDGKSWIHCACQAGCKIDHVMMVLQDVTEQQALGKQDDFGWNPLHYACAFNADDDALIKLIIEESAMSVTQKDKYGRFPLHIACDSEKVTVEVIRLLLAGIGKDCVLESTLYLGVRYFTTNVF